VLRDFRTFDRLGLLIVVYVSILVKGASVDYIVLGAYL
jgi:hypothetical protein